MTISITDPALLFPGISLLLLAYTNRFLALAGLIRQLNENIDQHAAGENKARQIETLTNRVVLIKYMQAFAVMSFLLCVIAMAALFFDYAATGQIAFGLSLLLIGISLCIALVEIMQSNTSLKIELETLRKQHTRNPLK